MIPGQLIALGQLTDPGVNFTSVHGLMPVRACSHEPRTVNYPRVMIAPGQVLPHVHMMICCLGAS